MRVTARRAACETAGGRGFGRQQRNEAAGPPYDDSISTGCDVCAPAM